MSILVTGKGGSAGSWKIRGEQLGTAMGAEVQPMAEVSDCRAAKVVVVVKRTPDTLMRSVIRSGRPWIWDIVDAWPQPHGNSWGEDQARTWLHNEIGRLAPDAVIFPTEAMREDCTFKGPSLVLRHHAWDKYAPRLVSPEVKTVGYDGDTRYLGRWRKTLENECARRNWQFSATGVKDADIGVAVRESNGYPARRWKSNCKLANIQALGIPGVLSNERGYQETTSGVDYFVDCEANIRTAFDAVDSYLFRVNAQRLQTNAAPRLKDVAHEAKQWLMTIIR